MTDHGLRPEQALKLHREFLQEILEAVLGVFAVGTASDDRLITGLEVYWEACLARRASRQAVIEATAGTSLGLALEPMGKPFLMMVRAELMPRRGKHADDVALAVYDEARAIAVSEALTGCRDTDRRQNLAALIRAT